MGKSFVNDHEYSTRYAHWMFECAKECSKHLGESASDFAMSSSELIGTWVRLFDLGKSPNEAFQEQMPKIGQVVRSQYVEVKIDDDGNIKTQFWGHKSGTSRDSVVHWIDTVFCEKNVSFEPQRMSPKEHKQYSKWSGLCRNACNSMYGEELGDVAFGSRQLRESWQSLFLQSKNPQHALDLMKIELGVAFWNHLKSKKINAIDELDESFGPFKKGTECYYVWEWFETTFGLAIGEDLKISRHRECN